MADQGAHEQGGGEGAQASRPGPTSDSKRTIEAPRREPPEELAEHMQGNLPGDKPVHDYGGADQLLTDETGTGSMPKDESEKASPQ